MLAAPPRPLRRVLLVEPADVVAWWASRVPLVVPREAVALLDAWARDLAVGRSVSLPDWRPEGPGRTPAEAAPLVALLRARAESGEPLTFSALWREPQGGRSYPFVLAGYDGPLTVSRRVYEDAGRRGPRLLLAAIRRDVRGLLRAPRGWSLVELDFRACHPAIGLALSGDEQLARDLDADIHQAVGDMIAPDLAPAEHRAAGKRLNNAMLFGLSPRGVHEFARELRGREPAAGAGEALWHAWWGRYPRLAAFRDEVAGLVAEAQARRWALEVEAPSGRVSRWTPAEVAGRVGGGRPAPGVDGVWRLIWSAAFRAVEGDLLDATLRHLHAANAGTRLVLPMYDGALVAAPAGAEDATCEAIERAAADAVAELGVPGLRAVARRR